MEHTGYADPSVSALVQLSFNGRKAAVVRDNIQAHVRFGGARDGALLFDDDEYIFIGADERTRVPDGELRPLFDLAWTDVDSDDRDEEVDPVAVALAMAELVTGIVLTADDFTPPRRAAPQRVARGPDDELRRGNSRGTGIDVRQRPPVPPPAAADAHEKKQELLHLGTQDRAQPEGQRDPEPDERGDAELLPVLRGHRVVEEAGDGEVDDHPRLQVAGPLLEGGEGAEGPPAAPRSTRSSRRRRRPSCAAARPA